MVSTTSTVHATRRYLAPSFFFLTLRPPPRSTLFPYTTLFRSDSRSAPRYSTWSIPTLDADCAVLTSVGIDQDRKSTRLNSSHTVISYAVFCLKKKKNKMEKSLLVLLTRLTVWAW